MNYSHVLTVGRGRVFGPSAWRNSELKAEKNYRIGAKPLWISFSCLVTKWWDCWILFLSAVLSPSCEVIIPDFQYHEGIDLRDWFTRLYLKPVNLSLCFVKKCIGLCGVRNNLNFQITGSAHGIWVLSVFNSVCVESSCDNCVRLLSLLCYHVSYRRRETYQMFLGS